MNLIEETLRYCGNGDISVEFAAAIIKHLDTSPAGVLVQEQKHNFDPSDIQQLKAILQ